MTFSEGTPRRPILSSLPDHPDGLIQSTFGTGTLKDLINPLPSGGRPHSFNRIFFLNINQNIGAQFPCRLQSRWPADDNDPRGS